MAGTGARTAGRLLLSKISLTSPRAARKSTASHLQEALSDASAKQRDGGERDEQAERRRDDQKPTQLSIGPALDHKELIEIFGLQLARDEGEVHERCHQI